MHDTRTTVKLKRQNERRTQQLFLCCCVSSPSPSLSFSLATLQNELQIFTITHWDEGSWPLPHVCVRACVFYMHSWRLCLRGDPSVRESDVLACQGVATRRERSACPEVGGLGLRLWWWRRKEWWLFNMIIQQPYSHPPPLSPSFHSIHFSSLSPAQRLYHDSPSQQSILKVIKLKCEYALNAREKKKVLPL